MPTVSAFCNAEKTAGSFCGKLREVDLFVVVIADQLDGVFEHGHHAEAEQIDFDDAHVGAVFLVPLDDDAAGHGGGLERHDGIEASLADHHAAGVLAEMPRQILDREIEIEEFADARIGGIETGFAELRFGGVD